MERTEPVNPQRKTNLLLKILLYPQVSGFKIVKAIPAASNYRKNYHDRTFSVAMILFTEIYLFNYFDPRPKEFAFSRFLFVVCVFHTIMEFFFDKKINEMAFDYYSYYNKILLYIFLVFMMIGFAGLCISLYNDIGHLPAK